MFVSHEWISCCCCSCCSGNEDYLEIFKSKVVLKILHVVQKILCTFTSAVQIEIYMIIKYTVMYDITGFTVDYFDRKLSIMIACTWIWKVFRGAMSKLK